MRLECYELISILGFIIKYINNIEEYTDNIENDFNARLKILLNEIDVKDKIKDCLCSINEPKSLHHYTSSLTLAEHAAS